MTAVYITIDTEYAAGLAHLGRAENYARSIACETPSGPAGLFYKMRLMERHGLKGVFFVDPMPALLWGRAAIADVVGPIVEAGHDVQLHCHTEWLERAGAANPFGKIGTNIADFAFDDQCAILGWARDMLVSAGAPPPVAFRAGNYGANDDTLRAPPSSVPVSESSICAVMCGTPAIRCTLPILIPGAPDMRLGRRSAPSGTRAMRRRPSLSPPLSS